MGIPCTFIRFAGCNLRCVWCDTKNSWDEGTEMEEAEIISQIHHPHVILTGGEPTLYDLQPLCTHIHQLPPFPSSPIIAVETNGTNRLPTGEAGPDWVVCSPKPASDYVIQCVPNELKYVVDREFRLEDIAPEWIGKIPVWLQPNNADFAFSVDKCYQLAMTHPGLRVGAQLHLLYHLK